MAKGSQMGSREWFSQYFVAGAVVVGTIGAFYQYGVIRYGVGGLSTLNKSLATSTLFLLGIVLLLGPLARMFSLFDRAFKYRKELGVLTLYTAAAHVYLSMFVLARNGPWGLYLSQPISAYSGLVALGIMVLLIVVSVPVLASTLGMKIWWNIQNWGARLAFVLISLHFVLLKYSGIATWLEGRAAVTLRGASALPPLEVLGVTFAAFVLIVRLSELFGQNAAGIVTKIAFLATVAITIWFFL